MKDARDPEPVLAAISPHAGYVYSGPVAGKVIAAIDIPPEVLILGPNHTGAGTPLSLFPEGRWTMPMGEVEISSRLNEAILKEVPGAEEDTRAHEYEHCAEVQVPFLQARRPDVKISVLIFGRGDLQTLLEVGAGLAEVVKGSETPVLLLASSDMTHYESQEMAKKKDNMALEEILDMDPEGLYRVVRHTPVSMCGYAPSISAMKAAKDCGATTAEVIDYRTSGDETGDYSAVVGYAGVIIK
jgi:AmmeMemoRadiSam system protein B